MNLSCVQMRGMDGHTASHALANILLLLLCVPERLAEEATSVLDQIVKHEGRLLSCSSLCLPRELVVWTC